MHGEKDIGGSKADEEANLEDGNNNNSGAIGKTSGMVAEDYLLPERDDKNHANDNDDDDDDASLEAEEDDAHDLNYSNQSDYEQYSTLDSDDELHMSFQKNKSPNLNRVQGGPIIPDVSKMSEYDAEMEMKKYKVERKKFTDRARHNCIKLAQSTVNTFFDASVCTGDNSDCLRPMVVVEKLRLQEGHTFVSKEIAWMRIAEEANCRRIKVTTEISNLFNLYVSGDHFRVQVNFSEKYKLKVKLAAVWENDVGVDIPIDDWLKMVEGKKEPAKKLKGEKITPF